MISDDYAGKYLRTYEKSRYTIAERFYPVVPSLIVPEQAETFADVSFWQEGVDWDEYAKHARAVILRTSQGNWKDTSFETFYAAAKARNLVVGGYHFYDDRHSPSRQAQTIIDALAGKTFEMELFIDWEVEYTGNYKGLHNVVALMEVLIAAGLKVKGIGLYTGYYFFKEHSNNIDHRSQYAFLSSKPLWLAWYASAAIVKAPEPWSESSWIHWQLGTPKVAWGQPTAEIDMNKSRFTTTQFGDIYVSTTTPPPTTPPPTPKTYFGRMTAYLTNIRSTPPGGSYIDIGDLLQGDEVVADEVRLINGQPWWHLTDAKRNGAPVLTSNGVSVANRVDTWCWGNNLEEYIPVPPPDVKDVPWTFTIGDDKEWTKETVSGILKKI